MKTKILSLLVLASFLFPIISYAAVVPPFVSLTIIVNTEQDATFHYELSGGSIYIQTQGLQGSKTIYFYISGGSYNLSQDLAPGLSIDNVFCASTNTATAFSYYPNGAIFTPVGYEDIICAFNNAKAPTKTGLGLTQA